MAPLKQDAARELERALGVNLVNFGGQVAVEDSASRSWASATFTGARHTLRVRLAGAGAAEAAERFVAGLSEAEFDLRGHIVADIALLAEERREGGEQVLLTLEALTVEDG
jgi:hypothetical protein